MNTILGDLVSSAFAKGKQFMHDHNLILTVIDASCSGAAISTFYVF
jgi:hypothetical protein